MLNAMIRDGITLARSLELTVQWDGIIRIGPVHPLTVQDFDLARRGGLGEWRQVVEDLQFWLSHFIHRVVVHRREEGTRGWRNWLREDPLTHSYKWLRPDLVLGIRNNNNSNNNNSSNSSNNSNNSNNSKCVFRA